MTQHHRQVNRPVQSGSAVFAAGQVMVRVGLASTGVLIGTRCPPTSRAPYAPPARMTERKTHAFGVDDIAGSLSCPRANRVLRMGHSIRAQMGHSLAER